MLLGMSLQYNALINFARELMQLHVLRQQLGWASFRICMSQECDHALSEIGLQRAPSVGLL